MLSKRHVAAATALLVSAPGGTAPPGRLPLQVSDTLRLYYVGYPIGRERYELTTLPNGLDYRADFDWVDRGRRTHLMAAAQLAADFTPRHLEISRLTDSSTRVDTRVVVSGRTASVERLGRRTEVQLPERAFAISGQSPVSQHLLLLRYWLAHGRPPSLAVVPGGPTNEVRIVARGRDTLTVHGQLLVLDRYAVDGVVWGWGSVWLDADQRLAGFTTAGGGGLTFEAVRTDLDDQLLRLRAIATRDRLSELSAASRTVQPVATGKLALVGATLITGTDNAAVPNATIVIDGGRVIAAGPSAAVAAPRDARRIDLRGKTIAPGLWDMHAHLMQWEWAPVYLAAGVTTVRDMGNVKEFIVPFRAAVDSGKGLGPHMVLAGLIDGGGPNAFGAINASTPEQGRSAVRMYHALGFQQMKLYSLLTPAVVSAICDEAHRLGMTVTGHIPYALTLLAAVDSGMDHVAHLAIRGDAGSDSVRMVIDSLKAHHTIMDPTASWGELGGHSTAIPVASFQPGVNRVPPVLAQRINAMGAAIDTATWRQRFTRALRIIGQLRQAGVPVVPGTDEGLPGYSVYRELELYVQAGFTPNEAIQSATVVSARAMGLQGSRGTLEPGKEADLIVLDGNPIDDIANLRTVTMVMKDGVLYRSADIWKAIGFK